MQVHSKIKLIILDRDGVINEDRDDFVKSVDEFQPIPGSIEAIVALKKAGYRVAIATNQSGLARGLFTRETLDAMHAKLANLLAVHSTSLDYVAICPHGPDDQCACRKPKPGLLQEICFALNTKPQESLFIGDSYRDYEAAKAIQMSFALVQTGKGLHTLKKYPELTTQIPIFDNLGSVVAQL